jgi:hypothetical protein
LEFESDGTLQECWWAGKNIRGQDWFLRAYAVQDWLWCCREYTLAIFKRSKKVKGATEGLNLRFAGADHDWITDEHTRAREMVRSNIEMLHVGRQIRGKIMWETSTSCSGGHHLTLIIVGKVCVKLLLSLCPAHFLDAGNIDRDEIKTPLQCCGLMSRQIWWLSGFTTGSMVELLGSSPSEQE